LGRFIAIDYGGKRTGIAVTDPSKIIASALTTVESEKAVDFLKNYCQSEPVDSIVVGLPINLNGEATHGTALVKIFLEKLKLALPEMPIDTHDERFTSKMAVQSMIAAGTSKKNRQVKGNVDKISAVIILQEYMTKKGF
jgi:putative Holliday junction resolvase